MNKRAIVTDRERQLVEGRGGIMEMKQTIADREAEIERLRDSLERIACFCQEECKMNCAGWIASSALKEKE